ncbi:MAG: hypothetical protein ACREND_06750 [Gemmatimonadaceae bacterium]
MRKSALLLTATPMQVHPVELWDLLDLLGLSAAWDQSHFLRFFELIGKPAPSEEIRVTTDAELFDEHADSFELWSPGSPAFPDLGDC